VTGVVELRGKRVRVWVYRRDGDIYIEIASAWDPTYGKPVVLITSESKIREDAEALVDEIAQLLRKVVEIVVKGGV
jgi:hypothetical protein